MREFWIYTGMRLAMFIASAGIVFGIWFLATGDVPVLYALIIAAVVSGVASYFLLRRQRDAFAARVEAGPAARMAERLEAAKTKEDQD